MAVASLVLGIVAISLSVSFCCGIFGPFPAVAAIILCHVSRWRINNSELPFQGRRIALAGGLLGYLVIAFWLGIIIWGGTKKGDSGISAFQAAFEPGSWTFGEAQSWLRDSSPGEVNGNSEEAILVGREFLQKLSEIDAVTASVNPDGLSVWCELRGDRCAILCADPGLFFTPDHWKEGAGEAAFKAAAESASGRLQGSFAVALGVQGFRFFPFVIRGRYDPDAGESLVIDQILHSITDSEHRLYRFFSDAPFLD